MYLIGLGLWIFKYYNDIFFIVRLLFVTVILISHWSILSGFHW
jgi:hypothetical protein